jgi:hypothetical protein
LTELSDLFLRQLSVRVRGLLQLKGYLFFCVIALLSSSSTSFLDLLYSLF